MLLLVIPAKAGIHGGMDPGPTPDDEMVGLLPRREPGGGSFDGVALEDIVPMVTSHAAQLLGLESEIGSLRQGAVADVSVLADERGRWVLRDNEGTEAVAERMLCPLFCLCAGRRVDADAPILPMAQAA